MTTENKAAESSLIEEYKNCQSVINGLDNVKWQSGSLLFGGSLAAGGFILASPTAPKLFILSLLSTVALEGWRRVSNRSSSIQRVCAARMKEIEIPLGLHTQQYLEQAYESGSVTIGGKPVIMHRATSHAVINWMVRLYLFGLWFATIAIWLYPLVT